MGERNRTAAKQAMHTNFSSSAKFILQRACDCGQHVQGESECEDCRKKREGVIQRKPLSSYPDSLGKRGGRGAPPVVHQAMRSSGQPLEPGTQRFMESRFGHDFSRVRVHTGARAAASARAVHALAYTVGNEVVFGAGQYLPTTLHGRRLIAHELAHVVQQAGANSQVQGRLEIGHSDSRQEQEAEAAAQGISESFDLPPITADALTLRCKDGEAIPVDLTPTEPEEAKKLKEETGIDLPKVSEGTWRLIGGRADSGGKPLTNAEKINIEAILKKAGLPAATPLAHVVGPKFLLHDTSSPVGPTTISREQQIGKGPLGKGVSAWVPRTGSATIARPDFFESKRPSTTEFEKGVDIIKQADRESALRDVWSATKPTEKGPAIDRGLAGTGMSADQVKSVKSGAERFLSGTTSGLPDGSKTAAAWAVGELCDKAKKDGTASVALEDVSKGSMAPARKSTTLGPHAAKFEAGCKKLEVYFAERAKRVSSTVGVEIVQVGVKSATGNQNTCDPTNPNVKPMPTPPYSDEQYTNIALLYLRAALTAGSFPEITTHFLTDAFEHGHCDPRCFDLQKLYDTIAALLGHGKGSTYGVKPSYGTTYGTDSIWWDDKICGGKHP